MLRGLLFFQLLLHHGGGPFVAAVKLGNSCRFVVGGLWQGMRLVLFFMLLLLLVLRAGGVDGGRPAHEGWGDDSPAVLAALPRLWPLSPSGCLPDATARRWFEDLAELRRSPASRHSSSSSVVLVLPRDVVVIFFVWGAFSLKGRTAVRCISVLLI